MLVVWAPLAPYCSPLAANKRDTAELTVSRHIASSSHGPNDGFTFGLTWHQWPQCLSPFCLSPAVWECGSVCVSVCVVVYVQQMFANLCTNCCHQSALQAPSLLVSYLNAPIDGWSWSRTAGRLELELELLSVRTQAEVFNFNCVVFVSLPPIYAYILIRYKSN